MTVLLRDGDITGQTTVQASPPTEAQDIQKDLDTTSHIAMFPIGPNFQLPVDNSVREDIILHYGALKLGLNRGECLTLCPGEETVHTVPFAEWTKSIKQSVARVPIGVSPLGLPLGPGSLWCPISFPLVGLEDTSVGSPTLYTALCQVEVTMPCV